MSRPLPRCPNQLLAQRARLVAAVRAEKATIRQARARLGAAKAELVELEDMCRRLGIGFQTVAVDGRGGD